MLIVCTVNMTKNMTSNRLRFLPVSWFTKLTICAFVSLHILERCARPFSCFSKIIWYSENLGRFNGRIKKLGDIPTHCLGATYKRRKQCVTG